MIMVSHNGTRYRLTGSPTLYPRIDQVIVRGEPPRVMYKPVPARSIVARVVTDIVLGNQPRS